MPDKEAKAILNQIQAELLREEAESLSEGDQNSAEQPKIDEAEPGTVTEAEARKTLMDDAMRRKDQAAIMAIPPENFPALHVRWEKYVERIEREADRSPYSLSYEGREVLRKKRKKKRK